MLFAFMVGLAVQTGAAEEEKLLKELQANGYTAEHRLRYHGCAFYDDVLERKDMLRKLRGYMNVIMPWSAEHSLRGRYPVSLLSPKAGDEETLRQFLAKENERIAFLHETGFAVMWNLPLSELIRTKRFEDFEKHVRLIKAGMPEIENVEFVYFYDEPDLHPEPGTEDLERFIDIFKKLVPGPRICLCYAIAQPRFYDTVPPRNADMLAIDPYLLDGYGHNAAAFERFYQGRLALSLAWVNRWDKPYLLVADCFYRPTEGGKSLPLPEVSLWYYQLALTQPDCVGLAWFYYGGKKIESQNLLGLDDGKFPALEQVHREIGERILGEPTPLGIPGELGPAYD